MISMMVEWRMTNRARPPGGPPPLIEPRQTPTDDPLWQLVALSAGTGGCGPCVESAGWARSKQTE